MNEQIFLGGAPVAGFGAIGECPVVHPEGIYYGGRKVIALNPGALGAVQRANPLPPGKYWVDVFTPQEAAFQDWLQRNKANVIVTTTETYEPAGDYPGRVWRLFEVNSPVTWEGPGFPTIAGPGVKSSTDTADRPAPEPDPLDKLKGGSDDLVKSVANAAKIVLIVGAVVVGGVLIIHYLPVRQPAPPPPQRIP